MAAIDAWPAATPAAAVVGPAGVIATHGPTSSILPLASVTKPIVALAVLIAVEEGTIGLDDAAGPPGATVRHLLAHASGLPFAKGPPIAPPGARRIYSNRGFELLGRHLESAAGMPVGAYVVDAVLAPLGMTASALTGSPASGAASSVDDLCRFAAELLTPTLIAPTTLAEATAVQLPGLAGVVPGFGRFDPNDWGLGFELKGTKTPHWTASGGSPRTFGHFGAAGSFLWVDPDAHLALVCLADHPFDRWAITAWPALSAAVLSTWANPTH
ncbi:MAG: serine hydrolase domain-containing protein [Acidimicrobiales bacterium]